MRQYHNDYDSLIKWSSSNLKYSHYMTAVVRVIEGPNLNDSKKKKKKSKKK